MLKSRKNKSNAFFFSFGLRMKEDEQWLQRFVTRNDNDETLCVCCYQQDISEQRKQHSPLFS